MGMRKSVCGGSVVLSGGWGQRSGFEAVRSGDMLPGDVEITSGGISC